ncbi:MAG: tetratricopeptide repeat protein [Candidatus Hodarchaeota archaeon]
MLAPPDMTLETLFSPKQMYCFLAGSGISLDAPSCLPTGYQFTRAVLERMIPEEERAQVLELMNPEREGMKDPGDFLRFEKLMGYLQKWFDSQLNVLDGYADCKTVNPNHLALALLLVQGCPVFTTNFDSLIEQALIELKIPHKCIWPVISKEDWQSKAKPDQYSVHKLHGSLNDIRTGKDSRESLQATLEQITQEKGEDFQLEAWKRHVFEQILQQFDLIVIGYSGLDDFDVLPTLRTITSPKRVLWITHADYSVAQAQIECIHLSSKDPESSSPDRVGANLLTFEQYQTRQAHHLVRIFVHTGQFLQWLAGRSNSSPIPSVAPTPCPEDIHVPVKHLELAPSMQWFLTGKIYEDRNLVTSSLQIYQTALTCAQQEENIQMQGICLNSIGLILSNQGRVDEALTHYQQALQIAEQLEDIRGKAATSNNIGLILANQGRLDEALTHFQQTFQMEDQLGDTYRKANTLNNIGWLLYIQRRLDEAVPYYQQALQIDEQLGDLHGKTIRLNNIGLILADQGRLDEALTHYQQALQITEQMGDIYGKATLINNIGRILEVQGRLDEALTHYQQALQIDEQLGDLQGKTIRLNNISRQLEAQGRLDEALTYFRQALQIAEQLGDIRMKATLLNNIGNIMSKQNRLDEALTHFQQALAIFQQLEDPQSIRVIQTNIYNIRQKMS